MIMKTIGKMIGQLTKQLTFGDGIIIAGVVFLVYHYWYKLSQYFNMMGF